MAATSLNGVIIIDKPPGVTSQVVVAQVKKILKVRKAGHTGTLDPFATGVLPVCLNEGTKLSPFLMEQDKEYEGVILLGVETDTQDSTGNVVREAEPPDVNFDSIERIFSSFEGTIAQTPPMFSAIKHNGVPLYKLARKGLEVQRAARSVTIYALDLRSMELPRLSFRVACSKGTYVRTLSVDIGTRLGCGASLESLRRIRSGQFSLERAISLDALKELSRGEIAADRLISPAEALAALPGITVDERIAGKVRHGMPVIVEELGRQRYRLPCSGSRIRVMTADGQLLAVAETVEPNTVEEKREGKVPAWKLLRVFNLF
jgi:tRNA pseudouridine55 synthase